MVIGFDEFFLIGRRVFFFVGFKILLLNIMGVLWIVYGNSEGYMFKFIVIDIFWYIY